MRVFALDPETGAERWVFDPKLRARETGGPYPLDLPRRRLLGGVGAARRASPASAASCTARKRLGADRARRRHRSALRRTSAQNGRVALREGIGEAEAWEYYPTSPPLVIGDLAVIGALVADQLRVDAPSGVVRAFDVRSGRRVWAWDPVPPGFAVTPRDGRALPARHAQRLVAALGRSRSAGSSSCRPGNPSPDSFGGLRHGLDYYGSSTVALDARTGEVVWHFQTVHHDVWDFDVPAQPTLFQIDGVGGGRPAVAQPTKMGHLFLLDRETGEPLYPVEERPVPQGGVPGETLSPTQPFPTHPAPLHPYELSVENAFGFTPIDRASCREQIAKLRWDGAFTPPSLAGLGAVPAHRRRQQLGRRRDRPALGAAAA